jgi:hypothetical protein
VEKMKTKDKNDKNLKTAIGIAAILVAFVVAVIVTSYLATH